jgi:hypothetical protein
MNPSLAIRQPDGWPRDDVAHPGECCAACGLGFDGVTVVRLLGGRAYHSSCWSPPGRPPKAEVEAMWSACKPPVTAGDFEAAKYLHGRGLLLGKDLLRVLPRDYACPAWASWHGRSWAEQGYRLIMPVYDFRGELTLIRAWQWEHSDGRPKRLSAAALDDDITTVRGLVMAAGRGLELLRATHNDEVRVTGVAIVEGEPAWMAAQASWDGWAVLGIVSGSWTEELASRIPCATRVVLWTDHDAAGDRYARQIWETLHRRCPVERGRA